MRSIAALALAALATTALHAQQTQGLTLQQALSAPYASSLVAAPKGSLFAWVEDAEGRHNLFVGGKDLPAQQLTHNTADDAQDIRQLAWSPDATSIAYTFGAESGADGKPANPAHLQRATPLQIIVQPLAPSAKPVSLGEGHAPLFTHNGKRLLFVREGQIWIADLATSSSQQLVFDRGHASSLTLSPDGTQLAFISTRNEANEPNHAYLALFSLAAHTLRFPAANTGNDTAPAFAPDGSQLAWLRSPFTETPEFANPQTSPNPWSIQLLDLTTNQIHTAFCPAPNQPGSLLPHLSDSEPHLLFTASKHILFASEADGWVHLYTLDPASANPPQRLTSGEYEVEDPALSADGNTLVYASNQTAGDALDRDRRHLWQLDLTQAASHPVALTSGDGIEAHPAIAPSGDIAALVSGLRSPMQAALINRTGVKTPLHSTPSSTDDPTAAFTTPQQVLFHSTDGLVLHAQLFLPRNLDTATKHAAVLFLHGGPNRQMLLGYPSMDYYSNAYAMNQYLAARGFIVLSVNYRCGIGYGMDFRNCQHAGATGATEYNDLLAAAHYLHSRADVDPSRIGLWGGSYGGYLTALGLARNSDLFAAGVDFHGVHDWNLEVNASDWKRGSNAQQDATAARALASSPLAAIDRWRSPVLLIHGDNDPDVAYAQTPLLADALRARNVHVEELIFPDELHGFLLHRDWLAAYQAADAFLESTLHPEPLK